MIKNCTAILSGILLTSVAVGQVIVSDTYNVTGSGTGFALNTGVNSGINPPTTRLTGTAAANLRYLPTGTKTNTSFAISASKLRVTPAANPGRFTLSANGTAPFDFASALGVTTATPQKPAVYDICIAMANASDGTQRFSFALGTAEGDATTWDFGLQLYRTAATDNYYTIGKRIDSGSAGLAADVNMFITNTAPGTFGTEISFVMRVTDAGSETNSFNSRLQLSMDGGFTWFYDTASDPDLTNGWRLNGAGRYILWDVAPDAGNVTYDNFSIRPVPVSATLNLPQDNAISIGACPTLKVTPSNSAPGNVTVTFYGREAPKPYPGRDFCIAVLPDTQNYAREAAGVGDAVKEMWFAQTEWIITNRVQENIPYVAHLGDVVQNGDINNGSPNTTEWRNATNAMYRLENPNRTLLRDGIPYGMAVGNHDQEPNDDPDGTTEFYTQYFGISHFSDKAYYGGHFSTNSDSHFDLFSVSGLDFIVLYFENERYGSAIMNWANDVLSTNQNRRAIVVVHGAANDGPACTFTPQGQAVFDGLKDNTNFFLMLAGHMFDQGGESSRTDTYNGRKIRTFVSDFQGWTNGGNGFMRLIYFSPSNNLVTIKTYSPWVDEYETDANSQMSFTYNLQLPSGPGSSGTPYVALGTNAAVVPGAQTACTWPGLQPNRTYEWYAKVTDANGNTRMSSTRRFTTTINSAPVASNQTVTVVGDQPTQLTLLASDSNGDALTFQTNSRPVRGLNTSFDPLRGTITYLPARGYRGLDRFTYQASDSVATSAVATFDLIVVAPADSNSNGLPDAWETAYGVTDALADGDGDGQSNLAEYLANTDPTNAASFLRITNIVRQPNGSLTLAWPSAGGTRYRVQFSNGDTNAGIDGSFIDVIRSIDAEMDPSPCGSASTQSFMDTPPATNAARYYRIKVVP